VLAAVMLLPVLAGEEYRSAVPLGMVLVSVPLLQAAYYGLADALVGAGHAVTRAAVYGATILVLLVAAPALMTFLGPVGSAVAAVAGEGFLLAAFLLATRRAVRLRVDRTAPGPVQG